MTAVRSPLLKTVLALDACVCGLAGLALVLDAGLIAQPIGMPAGVMQAIGVFLVPYAALLAVLARRPAVPRPVVWALVALNVAFAADSVLSPLLGWATPDSAGWLILALQAGGALLVAALQVISLRRTGHVAIA